MHGSVLWVKDAEGGCCDVYIHVRVTFCRIEVDV